MSKLKEVHSTVFKKDETLSMVVDLNQIAMVKMFEKDDENFKYLIVFKGGAETTISSVGLLHKFNKFLNDKYKKIEPTIPNQLSVL